MNGINEFEMGALATRFRDAPAEFAGSPLYQALSPFVADDPDLLALVAQRRPGQQPTELLFASVHDLVLAGTDHPLREHFPSVVGSAAAHSPGDAVGPFQ